MLDPKQIDDLARRLADHAPKGLQVLQEDLNRSFRATLEAGLARLDLVTREEFDVQAAVLARSRAKLAALEKRVAALETAASDQPAPGNTADAPSA
ncbi:ubiquinone biosynthesis accessory factor UbiK [Halochromatium sp.]